jgi:hypothetical protein
LADRNHTIALTGDRCRGQQRWSMTLTLKQIFRFCQGCPVLALAVRSVIVSAAVGEEIPRKLVLHYYHIIIETSARPLHSAREPTVHSLGLVNGVAFLRHGRR